MKNARKGMQDSHERRWQKAEDSMMSEKPKVTCSEHDASACSTVT